MWANFSSKWCAGQRLRQLRHDARAFHVQRSCPAESARAMHPTQGFAGRDLLSSLHLPPMVTLQVAASFALLSVVDFSYESKMSCPKQTHKASLLNVKHDLRYLFTPHSWHSLWLHIPTLITAPSLCLSAEPEPGNVLAHRSVLPPSPTSCKLWLRDTTMLLSQWIRGQTRASPASCSDSLLLTM